jgi:hypothetical protein
MDVSTSNGRKRLSARRVFAVVVTTYGLGLFGWLLWPTFQESPVGKIVGIPPFSIYVFEHFGVPGLTDPNSCNWMWCKPTMFGIIFTSAVWLCAAWLFSAGISHLSRSTRLPTAGRSAPPRH